MLIRLFVSAIALIASAGVSAAVIYETDFSADSDAVAGGIWSDGQYSQNTAGDIISLALSDAAIGSSVDLEFELMAIGTWDQAGPLEDAFELSTTVMSGNTETVYTSTLMQGTNTMSISGIQTMAAGALEILFSSVVTGADELFAITQISVSNSSTPSVTPLIVASVPEPGTLVLLGLGLLGASLRRVLPVRS